MGVIKNIEGKKFGRLTVLHYSGLNKNRRSAMWMCKCECGNYKSVRSADLQNGNTSSCGCFKIENTKIINSTHGQNKRNGTTAEYSAWSNMKDRCTNEKRHDYYYYGGRGIKICDRWLNSFEYFFEDMGKKPSIKHSLDRFPDQDGNYEKDNCRWATKKEQANNVRNNKIVSYRGENKTLSEWRDELGFKYPAIMNRLKMGWSVEKAFETITDARFKK